MMPPDAYDAEVRAAVEVLHLRVLSLSDPAPDGAVSLFGQVVACFRGNRGLGGTVTLSVPTPPRVRIGPGPAIYRSREALCAAPFVEAHLTATGRIAGHGAGLVLLDDDLPSGPVWTPMSRR